MSDRVAAWLSENTPPPNIDPHWRPELLTDEEWEACLKATRVGFAAHATTEKLVRTIMRLCAEHASCPPTPPSEDRP